MIKSRRTRRVGHVAHIEEMRNVYKLWSENLRINWRIILKQTLKKQHEKLWANSSGSEQGSVGALANTVMNL
jgi:phage baseplate assembly protein gpV